MAQTILVTGSTSGFGRLTVETLARQGYRVFAGMCAAAGKNAPAAEELRALAQREQLALHIVEIDVTDDASVERAIAVIIETTGRLDVVVNNAGVSYSGPLEAFTLEQVRQQFETNVFSVLRVNRAVLPQMRKQGSGLLLQIGSIAGRLALPFQGLYGATKFALEGLTAAPRVLFALRRLRARVRRNAGHRRRRKADTRVAPVDETADRRAAGGSLPVRRLGPLADRDVGPGRALSVAGTLAGPLLAQKRQLPRRRRGDCSIDGCRRCGRHPRPGGGCARDRDPCLARPGGGRWDHRAFGGARLGHWPLRRQRACRPRLRSGVLRSLPQPGTSGSAGQARWAARCDLHRRLSRLQRSSVYRRSRGHPLWPTRHDLCLRDSGDDPGHDDGGCGLAPQEPAPAAAVSARARVADRPLEAAMSRHLALVTSKREATLKPHAEGIAWMRLLIDRANGTPASRGNDRLLLSKHDHVCHLSDKG